MRDDATCPISPCQWHRVVPNLCFLTEELGAAAPHSGADCYQLKGRIVGAIAIAEGLFREGPAPTLIGARHRATGQVVFPCPQGTELWEPIDLPRHGTLWSWTVQRFRPKSPPYAGPEAFEPFAIGYVELPGATIVEARLKIADPAALRIGMPMCLTFLPFTTDGQGRQVDLYAFEPVEAN